MGYIDRGDDEPSGQDQFADHFEWDGTGWLYFRDGWKAPVPLSDDEYHRAIAWHENGVLAVIAACALLVVVMMFAPLPWIDAWPENVRAISGILAIILFGLASFNVLTWLATRPFKDRTPVGPPRDKADLRCRRLANISWRRLFWTSALFTAALWVSLQGRPDHYAWVIWVFLLLQVAYQAVQKLRLERRPAASTSA